MKNILLFSIMAAFACGCSDNGGNTLKMITEPAFPPYEFMRGEEVVGIDVEIGRAVAQKLGKAFKCETVEFDSVMPAVISGKADIAVAGITVTEERKKNVAFSIPYTTTGLVVVYQLTKGYNGPKSLKGKRIGVQAGTTSEAYVLDDLKQKPVRSSSPAEAVAALKAGHVDYVIADIDPAKSCVKGEWNLKISDFISKQDYAVAIAKGRNDLLKAANETIAEIKADGRLAKWIAEYTKEADNLK